MTLLRPDHLESNQQEHDSKAFRLVTTFSISLFLTHVSYVALLQRLHNITW